MNVIIRKRQIIMSALVLALGSAVFVNWYFTKPENAKIQRAGAESSTGVSYSTVGDTQYVSATGEYTSDTQQAAKTVSAELSRKKAHDEAFDILKNVINDSSASPGAVDAATKQLAALTNTIKLESDIEALVKSKCGIDCIVLINAENAEVACDKKELGATAILQIKEIILKHTDIKAENITIFEIK